MATIFQKISGVDNCLILDSREALLYPFDVGDWSELRIGAMFSLVGNSGDNTPGVSEALEETTVPQDKIFIGLKDNSDNFPMSTGSYFFGIGTNNSQEIDFFANKLRSVSYISSSGLSASTATSSMATESITISNAITGTTNYLGFSTLKITKSGNSYSGNYLGENPNFFKPDSIFLRQKMRNAFFTNFINSTNLPSSGMDNVFIYLPLFNNRLRIHNLVVEKFK